MNRYVVMGLIAAAFGFGFFAGRSSRPQDEHAGRAHAPAEGHAAPPAGHAATATAAANPSVTPEALAALKARLAANPQDPDAILSYLESGAVESSEELRDLFGRVGKLAWDSPSLLERFATVAIGYGAYPIGQSAAERLIALAPKNPAGYRIAGRIAIFHTEDYAAAERHYTKVLELAPDDPGAPMLRRAIEMIRSGQIGPNSPLAAPKGGAPPMGGAPATGSANSSAAR